MDPVGNNAFKRAISQFSTDSQNLVLEKKCELLLKLEIAEYI
jgi:hypothetical protein